MVTQDTTYLNYIARENQTDIYLKASPLLIGFHTAGRYCMSVVFRVTIAMKK